MKYELLMRNKSNGEPRYDLVIQAETQTDKDRIASANTLRAGSGEFIKRTEDCITISNVTDATWGRVKVIFNDIPEFPVLKDRARTDGVVTFLSIHSIFGRPPLSDSSSSDDSPISNGIMGNAKK